MIRVQKIEGKNCLGTEHRRRVPTSAQELAKFFEESVFGAIAETDADGVVAGKVDDKYPLRSFHGERTTILEVSKVDDQAETLKGYAFKKAIRPGLKPKLPSSCQGD